MKIHLTYILCSILLPPLDEYEEKNNLLHELSRNWLHLIWSILCWRRRRNFWQSDKKLSDGCSSCSLDSKWERMDLVAIIEPSASKSRQRGNWFTAGRSYWSIKLSPAFWPDDKTGSYVNAMWRILSSEQLDERSHCPDAWSAALQLICLDRNKGPSICLIWKLCSQIGCLIMTGQTSCKKVGVWVSSGIALYLETNVLD